MENCDFVFRSKDLFTFISAIPNMRGKAYVTFVLSSGMKQGEVLNLTIGDLINACEDVFGPDEDKTLERLLAKDSNKIVPMWHIKKTNLKKITFSSTESMHYLFIYLRERKSNHPLSLDDPLFDFGNKKNVSEQMNLIFKNFKIVEYNYEKPKRIIKSQPILEAESDGFFIEDFFHFNIVEETEEVNFDDISISSETLREHFKNICNLFLPSFVEKKKKLREYAMKGTHNIKHRKLCELFVDGLKEDERYFKYFTSDKNQLKEYYLGIQKYLTTNEFDAIESVYFKNIEEREYGSSFLEKIPPNELDKYIDEYFTRLNFYSAFDKETADEIINIFKFNIHRDNEHNLLKNSEIYFNWVLDDAMLEYEIKSDSYFENISIPRKFVSAYVNQIIEYMDDKKLFNSYGVDKDKFEDYFINHVQNLIGNDKSTKISKRIIMELLLKAKYSDESEVPLEIYLI